MEDIQVKLSAVWVALMLTYLLGDVLRIFSGDFEAEKNRRRVSTHARNVVVNRSHHVDSDRYGCADIDFGVSRDSLGKHHRSHRSRDF